MRLPHFRTLRNSRSGLVLLSASLAVALVGVFLTRGLIAQNFSMPGFSRPNTSDEGPIEATLSFEGPVDGSAEPAEAALLVNFVRPGLEVTLADPVIDAGGTLSVEIWVTDDKGLPLDRHGIFTPGDVSMRFIAARLPSPTATWVAYTTRTAVGETGTAVQATSDSGGSLVELETGHYRYTFGTTLPSGFPAHETHAIGVYATRDLTEYELGEQFSNDVLEWVPNGAEVMVRRDLVSTEACNTCHDPLALHGGSRQEVGLCVLCHSAQTSDPDSGNTVDFRVMIHKIHRGADLPSVRSGTPYQIIGFRNSVHDYSDVVFPDQITRCDHCHQGASQSMAYLTRPSRVACGSCHDNVDFATGAGHPGGAQADDGLCSTCHVPFGEMEFDASILGAHTIPTESASLPGTVMEIVDVTNTSPGSRPTVEFSIHDKDGNPVALDDMSRLALVLAGPTSDYSGYVSENALNGATGVAGNYAYTFDQAISADFSGTMAVGIEGYRTRPLMRSDGSMFNVRDAATNDVFYFATDGGEPEARRQVVSIDNCNSCHGNLSVHGDNRNDTEMCVLCHSPMTTDANRRPAEEGPPESVHFATMIHKIHTGEDLETDYTVFGFGGTAHEFNDVLFPGDRRNCSSCHVDGSEAVPIPSGTLPVLSPRGLVSPLPPNSAACLGCHTSVDALVHTMLQSNEIGESCGVCHGPDRDFAVSRVHAR